MSSKFPPAFLLPVLIIATIAWVLYANWRARSLPELGEDILGVIAYAATIMAIVGIIIWIGNVI